MLWGWLKLDGPAIRNENLGDSCELSRKGSGDSQSLAWKGKSAGWQPVVREGALGVQWPNLDQLCARKPAWHVNSPHVRSISDKTGRGESGRTQKDKGTEPNSQRANRFGSSGEHGFKHRAQWALVPSPSSGERTQRVPLNLWFVCQRELTELFAELAEFGAELSELNSVPKQHSRNNILPVSELSYWRGPKPGCFEPGCFDAEALFCTLFCALLRTCVCAHLRSFANDRV